MNAEPRSLNILIADDHALIRSGFAQLLSQWDPATLVGQAADGIQLEALLGGERQWDLLLVDLVMPRFDGIAAVSGLLERFPGLPVIVVSATDDAATMRELLAAGVAGFLPKATDSTVVLKAIELVLAGGRYVPPLALRPGEPGSVDGLSAATGALPVDITARQREILVLLRRGLPNKVIAGELSISEATVKMHMTSLLRRYNVRSRAELIVLLK